MRHKILPISAYYFLMWQLENLEAYMWAVTGCLIWLEHLYTEGLSVLFQARAHTQVMSLNLVRACAGGKHIIFFSPNIY